MIGRTNASSGGALNKSTIIVTAPTGSTVTCNSGNITRTAPEKNGSWAFYGLDVGTWTITATKSGKTATKSVTITRLEVEYVTIAYTQIPEFTYTGDYEIVDDLDEPITVSRGNWKIRFLTSGTLTFTNLNGAADGIDVFLVGAGGGGGEYSGGGGGYTTTGKGLNISALTEYAIAIPAGGGKDKSGGNASAFGLTANGGNPGNGDDGGNGGSGGGRTEGGLGGSDGNDASGGNYSGKNGKGQGTTTREFGESGAKLYAGGGNGNKTSGKPGSQGGGGKENESGKTNTGGGSGCYESNSSVKGGSGIVIIRNHRA